MKKFALLLSIFILFNCNKPDENNSAETLPQSKITLFDIDVVPEIILEFEVKDWNNLLEYYDQNPKNENKVVSKFTYNINGTSVSLDSIGLKLRGNTSRRRPEGNVGEPHNSTNTQWHHCHFGLDFSNYIENQQFEGLEKLNLKWFKDDATYAREIYSYDLFKRFGCWTAPRASYCKITIKVKGDNKPAYFGVYAMIESIDEVYIKNRQSQWGSSIGFLWKGGWSGNDNANFYSTNSMGVEEVNLDASLSKYFAYDLKTRKKELETAKIELTQFINDLNNKKGEDFKNWISQKMDVNLFLKTYATNVMLGMWDDYWINGNNFYFYFAPNGKAYFIPYDYDNTLGTSLIVKNSGTQNMIAWGKYYQRPLITKLLENPEFLKLYKNYIKELADSKNDFFDPTKSKARIHNWHFTISNFVYNDTGDDLYITDQPAYWGNQPNYRLLSGDDKGGVNGESNYFETRIKTINW